MYVDYSESICMFTIDNNKPKKKFQIGEGGSGNVGPNSNAVSFSCRTDTKRIDIIGNSVTIV